MWKGSPHDVFLLVTMTAIQDLEAAISSWHDMRHEELSADSSVLVAVTIGILGAGVASFAVATAEGRNLAWALGVTFPLTGVGAAFAIWTRWRLAALKAQSTNAKDLANRLLFLR